MAHRIDDHRGGQNEDLILTIGNFNPLRIAYHATVRLPAGSVDSSRAGMNCMVLSLTRMNHGHYPVHMKAITYTAAREGLASTMDEVCRDRAPVIITRNRDQAVVMMSLDDYQELEETAHLLRSPANAKRLLTAIQALDSGKGRPRKISMEP